MLKPGENKLSLSRQCRLLGISRSSVYYKPTDVKAGDLELMRLIDEQYLQRPFYGSRSMTLHLRRQGHPVNRKRIQRLMRQMGLEAIYPKPHTSRRHPGHKIYPYLLRDLCIQRPNQVWATDITYIPLNRGFMFLVAVMDWHSRRGAFLETVQHLGCRLLRDCAARSHHAPRPPRDLQHGPGSSVHQPSLHQCPGGPKHFHKHGWARPCPGQHLHRAALVDSQVPIPLSTILRKRYGLAAGTHGVVPLLQLPTSPSDS